MVFILRCHDWLSFYVLIYWYINVKRGTCWKLNEISWFSIIKYNIYKLIKSPNLRVVNEWAKPFKRKIMFSLLVSKITWTVSYKPHNRYTKVDELLHYIDTTTTWIYLTQEFPSRFSSQQKYWFDNYLEITTYFLTNLALKVKENIHVTSINSNYDIFH